MKCHTATVLFMSSGALHCSKKEIQYNTNGHVFSSPNIVPSTSIFLSVLPGMYIPFSVITYVFTLLHYKYSSKSLFNLYHRMGRPAVRL